MTKNGIIDLKAETMVNEDFNNVLRETNDSNSTENPEIVTDYTTSTNQNSTDIENTTEPTTTETATTTRDYITSLLAKVF